MTPPVRENVLLAAGERPQFPPLRGGDKSPRGVGNPSPAMLRLPRTRPARQAVRRDFDAAQSALWITMAQQPQRPQSFSPDLLDALQELIDHVGNGGAIDGAAAGQDIHYAILRSAHPEYFSVGGDLACFLDCIHRGDAAALRGYSMQCLDMIYRFATVITQRSTTIALVQGRALGGGFEAALAADYIIAEEQAQFGLPEILFGLFPCTGAMSLLARRIGGHAAERLMRDGRIYTAADLEAMGVIDKVCPRGQGEAAVRAFVAEHARRRKARHALEMARHRMERLDYAELTAVVDDWVACAMQLDASELRVLDTLVSMQRAEFAH
jgi:DSF synthase